MKPKHLIAAAALATTGLIAAQGAMADQIDDIDEVGKLEVSDERDMAYAVGYLFSDRLGIELNGTEAVEHRLSTAALDSPSGGVDRLPVNLTINYYPRGGSGSRIQPYVGAGLDYTHVSEEELEALDVDTSYGLAGQIGLDMAVTRYLLVGAFARYANVEADVSVEGSALGEADIDPMTLGGGATFRF